MPAAAAVGIAAGGAIAGIYGAKKQSEAAAQAADITKTNDQATLAFAKQQEATRKAEYDAQQAALQKQWDAQQAIRAPYRAAGANALTKLGDILGVNFGNGLTTPAGPTPSTPASLGTQPGQTVLNPTQAAAVTNFNQGADAIQTQLNQSPAGTMPPNANPTDPKAILDQLQQNYQALGVTPTGPGSGPTDIGYYAGKVAETGGLTPDNIKYWFGPTGRIASDLAAAPGGSRQAAATRPTAAPSLAPTSRTLPATSPLPLAGSFTTPGYTPIIPITGLMGQGPQR